MQPRDLIVTARRLAMASGKGRPKEADLRRAISTAYYAVFHALCRMCADSLIGHTRSLRSQAAWKQVYRAVEHKRAKERFKNKLMMKKFPKKIQFFSKVFIELQEKRHEADYNPEFSAYKSDVIMSIVKARFAVEMIKYIPIKDRRAISAWILFNNRN